MVDFKKAMTVASGEMMVRPDYIPLDTKGTEHLTRDDITMPRIAIAQGLSPQVIEEDSSYIDGLKLGHMFNTLLGTIYGKGPLEFCIVRADPPRGIEFIPLKEGGGVRDFDVPLNDPRMQFTDGEDGQRNVPIATKFYDYIIVLLPSKEMVALSFKSTGLKVAKQLNSLIKIRNTALYTGKYTLSSAVVSKGEMTYGVHIIGNAGFLNEEEIVWAKESFDVMKDKEVVIDRGESAEEPLPEKPPF